METRKFGNTGLTPSILGFGMMRLKRNADDTINEEWAIKTLRDAIDNGLTYVDTAYAYGDSERVTGLCLQDGYREKVTLATKLPVFRLECEDDFEKYLNEELERLQTDHIDVYLLHALSRDRWEDSIVKYNVLAHAERAKAEGKIRHIGFSFHDSLDAFKYILNAYDKWACVLHMRKDWLWSSWSLFAAAVWPMFPRKWPPCCPSPLWKVPWTSCGIFLRSMWSSAA